MAGRRKPVQTTYVLVPQETQSTAPQQPVPRIAYSIEEAAEMLMISRATLFRLIKNGVVTGVKLGRRRVFSLRELEDVLRRKE